MGSIFMDIWYTFKFKDKARGQKLHYDFLTKINNFLIKFRPLLFVSHKIISLLIFYPELEIYSFRQ